MGGCLPGAAQGPEQGSTGGKAIRHGRPRLGSGRKSVLWTGSGSYASSPRRKSATVHLTHNFGCSRMWRSRVWGLRWIRLDCEHSGGGAGKQGTKIGGGLPRFGARSGLSGLIRPVPTEIRATVAQNLVRDRSHRSHLTPKSVPQRHAVLAGLIFVQSRTRGGRSKSRQILGDTASRAPARFFPSLLRAPSRAGSSRDGHHLIRYGPTLTELARFRPNSVQFGSNSTPR